MKAPPISRRVPAFLSLSLLAAALVSSCGAYAAEQPAAERGAAVRRKLMQIIIPRLEFRDASVREAVDFLKQKSVSLDPDPDPHRRGVGIHLRLEPPKGIADQA